VTDLCQILECEYDDVAYAALLQQQAAASALRLHVDVPDEAGGTTNTTPEPRLLTPASKATSPAASLRPKSGDAQSRRPSEARSVDDQSDMNRSHDEHTARHDDDDEQDDVAEADPITAARQIRLHMRRSPTASDEPISPSHTAQPAFVDHPHIPKTIFSRLLQSISYGCLECDSKSATVRSIHYRFTLRFARRDEYCAVLPTTDKLGYVPLLPTAVAEDDEQFIHMTFEGRLQIGIAPSPLRFPGNEPLPTDRVFVELQKDDMPLLPPLAGILEPPCMLRSGDVDSAGEPVWTVVQPAPEASRGYANALMRVEFLGRCSADDRISLKEDLNMQVTVLDRVTYNIRTVSLHQKLLCSVEDGVVQSTRQVRPTNGTGAKPFVAFRFVDGADTSILGEAVRAVLARLHYHNTASDGIRAGRRQIRVTIESPGHADVVLYSQFEVEEIDAPTEIRLAHTQFTWRQPLLTVPKDIFRPCVQTPFVPVALGAIVFDEDTDRFGGGYIHIYVSSGQPGDCLAMVGDLRMAHPVFEALDVAPPVVLLDDGSIMYEGRKVATVVSGKVLRRFGEEMELTSMEDEVKLALEGNDECSIAAVQCLLRHIVFFNLASNAGPRGHQLGGAARDVTFDVEIGDGEQACRIQHVVQIKTAGSGLQCTEKATSLDLKEGSPQVRVGPLDVGADRVLPPGTFSTGWILCSVASGFEEGDTLAIRDDIDFKLQPCAAVPPPTKQSKRPPIDAQKKADEQFKARCETLISQAASYNMGEAALNSRGLKAMEITVPGVKEPAGLLTLHGDGKHMLIQFYAEVKGASGANKKLASALLRSIMYQHQVADAQQTTKVLRVLCSDNAPHTASQVHIALNIALVDDVTQIVLASQRRRCRVGMDPFPLLPYGHAILQDDDTDYFDGGHLIVSVTGTGLKGEQLTLVTPQRQFVAPGNDAPTAELTAPLFEGIFFTDSEVKQRANSDDDDTAARTIASIVRSGKDGASLEMKLAFPPLPDDWTGAGGVMSLGLASYLMNCVCYVGDTDRTKDAVRTVNVRIRDVENPVDGKTKFTLDVSPTMLLPAANTATVNGAVATPAIVGTGAMTTTCVGKFVAFPPLWEKPPPAGFIECFVENTTHPDSGKRFAEIVVKFDEGSAYVLASDGRIVFKERDVLATVGPIAPTAWAPLAEAADAGESEALNPPGNGDPAAAEATRAAGLPPRTRQGLRISLQPTAKARPTKAQLSALLNSFFVVTHGPLPAGTRAIEAHIIAGDSAAPDAFGHVTIRTDILSA
jgi:hypothetical protein